MLQEQGIVHDAELEQNYVLELSEVLCSRMSDLVLVLS